MTDHLQIWPPQESPRRSPAFLHRLGASLRRLAAQAATRRLERRAAAQLRGLDDRALKDIGLGRSEIAGAVRLDARRA